MSTATDTTYNGWKNQETWSASLWLENDEGTYNLVREFAAEAVEQAPDHPNVDSLHIWTAEECARFELADRLESLVSEMAPDLEASLFSDLMTQALGRVDWDEIARTILAES